MIMRAKAEEDRLPSRCHNLARADHRRAGRARQIPIEYPSVRIRSKGLDIDLLFNSEIG